MKPGPKTPPGMLNLREVTSLLGVSRESARRWLARKRIPIFRPSRTSAYVDAEVFEAARRKEIAVGSPYVEQHHLPAAREKGLKRFAECRERRREQQRREAAIARHIERHKPAAKRPLAPRPTPKQQPKNKFKEI